MTDSGPFAFDDVRSWPARIQVMGVGGGGGNAVNRMVEEELEGVEFVSVNTDRQALGRSRAQHTVQIGKKLTRGLGAGARPEIGVAALEEDREEIEDLVRGVDLVFIAAGMGGGTGTGAAPGIARLAREAGALTIAVVTKPFPFEGRKRYKAAEAGIAELLAVVDSMIVVPNERLLAVVGRGTPLLHAFKCVDEVLLNATRGVSDIIQRPGEVNVDFADVRTVMADRGRAVMGEGSADGEDRGRRAAEIAISSPFLDELPIAGAAGVLVNVTGGMDMSLQDVSAALAVVHDAAGAEAEIIFGAVHDPRMDSGLRVTAIAAGLRAAPPGDTQRTTTPERPSTPAPRTEGPPNLETPAYLRRQSS